MAPRGPSLGHYHLQGIGGNATANTDVECGSKAFVATSDLDHRESRELFFILSSFFWLLTESQRALTKGQNVADLLD